MNHIKRCLSIMLISISVITTANIICLCCNVLMDLWPLSSFSAFSGFFYAFFFEGKLYVLLFVLPIFPLLFISAFSIQRDHIVLPAISLTYLLCDLGVVMWRFIDGILIGEYWIYPLHWFIYLVVMSPLSFLLFIYCYNWFANHLRQRRIAKSNEQMTIPDSH